MNKSLSDRIMHFDRFDTDKYIEVVNAKNGIEKREELISSVVKDFTIQFGLLIIILIMILSVFRLCCM